LSVLVSVSCGATSIGGSNETKDVRATASTISAPGLSVFQKFTGQYGVSTDGFGGTSNSGVIKAKIPANSKIIAAYIYSAGYSLNKAYDTINIDGLLVNNQTVVFDKYYKNDWKNSYNYGFFKTGRGDVTSIVKDGYTGSATDDIYSFNIVEKSTSVDGEALVVVYENSNLANTTIAILEGGANINGDSTTLKFDQPMNTTDSNFIADMYLGISYSYPSQASQVSVNDTVITKNAGNYDDGIGADGGLITVGSYKDTYSPHLPTYTQDKEKYNLKQYITNGSSSIKVDTLNPSGDDNVFLAVFQVTGSATVEVKCDLHAEYAKGYQAGIEFCKANPTNCGIATSTTTSTTTSLPPIPSSTTGNCVTDVIGRVTIPNRWHLLGATTDGCTVKGLKDAGATAVWPYDPTTNNYSTIDSINLGSGFWIRSK
jgi:hypothetical protein